MSQETRKTPVESDSKASHERENLQGWIPDLSGPDEVRGALEKAFDYRGDVTITLKSGERIEGYVFDRRAGGPSLEQCVVRMIPRGENKRIAIRYADIARLEFTGKDTAAGKSFELWLQRYHEKKARGEQNTSLGLGPLK
jgi:hypothetical protein